MGFKRLLYNLLGMDYVGSYEQNIISRQTHLKHMLCRQIEESNLKLNKLPPTGAYIYTTLKKSKKKKHLTTGSIINQFKKGLP